jgi:hypothetical protein
MTHGFALESWAGQAAVDGYCKFWVKICMRSCAKPIQALPVITTGAADKLKTYHHPVIKNHRKEIVGSIETQFTLTN